VVGAVSAHDHLQVPGRAIAGASLGSAGGGLTQRNRVGAEGATSCGSPHRNFAAGAQLRSATAERKVPSGGEWVPRSGTASNRFGIFEQSVGGAPVEAGYQDVPAARERPGSFGVGGQYPLPAVGCWRGDPECFVCCCQQWNAVASAPCRCRATRRPRVPQPVLAVQPVQRPRVGRPSSRARRNSRETTDPAVSVVERTPVGPPVIN